LNIIIVTPARSGSRSGNRATAKRWGQFLEDKGHQVSICVAYEGETADLMIALHAWRSADSVRLFKQTFPDRPLIVTLTGTDIYKFQLSHPDICFATMDQADILICLNSLAKHNIPERYWPKLHVNYQSASAPSASAVKMGRAARGDHFDICVIGHLREEKDSLRAGLAARLLPEDSTIRILQAGRAQSEEWRESAMDEHVINPRYHWLEELPGTRIKALLVQSRAMVVSSIMEGGANVVSEACVAGTPVLASDIAGNIGLLGKDYPGYYPVKDTQALADLMLRAEREPAFLAKLTQHCETKANLFQPAQESNSINQLVTEALSKGR